MEQKAIADLAYESEKLDIDELSYKKHDVINRINQSLAPFRFRTNRLRRDKKPQCLSPLNNSKLSKSQEAT